MHGGLGEGGGGEGDGGGGEGEGGGGEGEGGGGEGGMIGGVEGGAIGGGVDGAGATNGCTISQLDLIFPSPRATVRWHPPMSNRATSSG